MSQSGGWLVIWGAKGLPHVITSLWLGEMKRDFLPGTIWFTHPPFASCLPGPFHRKMDYSTVRLMGFHFAKHLSPLVLDSEREISFDCRKATSVCNMWLTLQRLRKRAGEWELPVEERKGFLRMHTEGRGNVWMLEEELGGSPSSHS